MKVIFLDHDGVICLENNWGGRFKKKKKYLEEYGNDTPEMSLPVDARFDDFDRKSIQLLNEIIEFTGAEIVVSSDWKRWATVEEMGDYYQQQGINKKPIDFTPNLQNCTVHGDIFVWSKAWDLEQTRSIEIRQYLHDNPQITHWVAVDDLNMGILIKEGGVESEHEWGLQNFILTPKSKEGIKQKGIKEKIISYLHP